MFGFGFGYYDLNSHLRVLLVCCCCCSTILLISRVECDIRPAFSINFFLLVLLLRLFLSYLSGATLAGRFIIVINTKHMKSKDREIEMRKHLADTWYMLIFCHFRFVLPSFVYDFHLKCDWREQKRRRRSAHTHFYT